MRAPPHLPFLAGPPGFTVGLRPIPAAQWLAPDWEAAAVAEKRTLLDGPDPPVRALSGSAPIEAEAAALIAAAMAPGETPEGLADAARLVSDDLVALVREGQEWRVCAAALCAPTFFSVGDALGAGLAALHGPVPEESLPARIARVFDGLRPDLVLERFNWTVQAGARRFTPKAPAPNAGPPHLRVERQTIRKLPQTGAVLFTIRVSLDPLAPILASAEVRAAFARAWREAPGAVRTYKRWDALAPAVETLLS